MPDPIMITEAAFLCCLSLWSAFRDFAHKENPPHK
jgi:hypothetical protein